MATPHRLFQALVLAALVPTAAAMAHARPGPSDGPGPVTGLTYALDEMAPGVFAAIAQGVPYYVANPVVVVGKDAVLLVDSSAGTNEARALREAIHRVTDRPVRYVVDTHFHFDHALGHAAFPEALTIAHEPPKGAPRLHR